MVFGVRNANNNIAVNTIMARDLKLYWSNLTENWCTVIIRESLPATSDQPISSGCVINNDDIITMTSPVTLWEWDAFQTASQHQNPNDVIRSRSIVFLFSISDHWSTLDFAPFDNESLTQTDLNASQTAPCVSRWPQYSRLAVTTQITPNSNHSKLEPL